MISHPDSDYQYQQMRIAEVHRRAATIRLTLSATADDSAAGPSPIHRLRTAVRSILAAFARLSFASRPERPAAA